MALSIESSDEYLGSKPIPLNFSIENENEGILILVICLKLICLFIIDLTLLHILL